MDAARPPTPTREAEIDDSRSAQQKLRARISRSDPSGDEPMHYDVFEVSGHSSMRVLDVLRAIYEEEAPDLAFQYACRNGRCGTCA